VRVLHLNTERTWRGGERQTFWLARELQRRGHENWIACRPGLPLDRAATDAGLATIPVSPSSEADPVAAARLNRIIRERKVDLLHAHTGHAVGLGALATLGTPMPFVASRRVDFALAGNVLSRWKYSRLDRLAVISNAIRTIVMKGGFPEKRIAVVPSGIDATGYPSVAGRLEFRRARGISGDEVLIVHAGALVPHKDQATLLRAAALVFARLPGTRLVILGEGRLEAELRALAEGPGLAGRVDFPGHRPDVLEYIAAADVFVFSSVEEGLGTALLDAMAIGVPTVATRAGGIPDLYGGPGAPELVPPADPSALAAGILSVLADPAEAARRITRGMEIAARFSVDAMATRYEELYQSCMTARRR
jgi:glycosyltransferase involved in cell wall biosynthesis